jgi:hypothetical protein
MVLLPHENCVEKSSSSIKNDRRLPATTHSESECSNTVQSSIDNCDSDGKHADPSCDEVGSIDTSFSPKAELLVADINTDSSPLTPELPCIIKQDLVGSGGPKVKDKYTVESGEACKQGEKGKILAVGISTKKIDTKKRIPSPILSGNSDLSINVKGTHHALKVVVGGNHDMTTHDSCSDEVMRTPKISECSTMRSVSIDSGSDHVKSVTSSNSSSSSSSKQSPRKSFATPLAPISPYKAFNENRIERERLARKEPLQKLKLPDFPEKKNGYSFCSSEQKALGDEEGEFQRPNRTSSISNNTHSVSTSTLLLLVVVYISILLASCWHLLPTPDYSNPVSQSPWIGEHNATKLIDLRLNLIQERFQKVLVREDWKVLRMSPNVTIETMSSEDGSWPGYIRTCAIFQAKPQEILRHLGWLQFDETQKKVDRFHESAHLLFAPSHKSKVMRKVRMVAAQLDYRITFPSVRFELWTMTELITNPPPPSFSPFPSLPLKMRQTTQRPLVFPKREMTVALCEKTLRQSFTINNLKLRTTPMKSFTSINIPKGTSMNAMVNVNINLDALEFPKGRTFPWSGIRFPGQKDKEVVGKKKDWQKQRDRKERHMKAYQDMMGWFVPLEGGGTLLVFVMQVDLGPDIPHWAFFTAVAATAVWSMGALNKLSRNDK